MLTRSSPSKGDVSRDRHVRRAGMRWTQWCGAFLTRGDQQSCVRRSRVVLAPRPWRLSAPARAGVATV